MKMQPLVRVQFKENVNFPGPDAKDPGKVGEIDGVFPRRGSVATLGGKATSAYRAFFCEGFVVLEHVMSKNKVRYPMGMVKEAIFEEDVTEQLKAQADALKAREEALEAATTRAGARR